MPRAIVWQNRVDSYAAPYLKDAGKTYVVPADGDYQISHAKAAIAGGGILGRLPGKSVQRDFLPQAYSDFIYSIIIEELGVLGGMGVLLLYVMLLLRVGIIARKCERLFPKYLVIGSGLMIVFQALCHMAVNVNLFPVTGQPLPLISRGGTSTVLTCLYVGIILSVSHYGAKMSSVDNTVTVNKRAKNKNNEQDDLDSNSDAKQIRVEPFDQICSPIPY
jgi:cell division protein FtsW